MCVGWVMVFQVHAEHVRGWVGVCMYQMSLYWLVTSAIFQDQEFLDETLSPTNATKGFIKSKKLKHIALKELHVFKNHFQYITREQQQGQ